MAKRGAGDAVEVVSSIYRNLGTLPLHEWLRGVLDAAASVCGAEVGAVAYAFDFSGPPENWNISEPVTSPTAPELGEQVFQSFQHAPPDFRARLFPNMGLTGTYSATMGQLLTEQHEFGAAVAREVKAQDAVYLKAHNPDDRGVLLAFNLEGPRSLSANEHRRFSMIGMHIAASLRLARSVRANRTPDLVFSDAGQVVHLEPGHEKEAETLRTRALAVARSNRSNTTDSERLEVWTALVDGRYTLIDRFCESDRHYVVAYANEPGVRDPRGLGRTEEIVARYVVNGHTQKEIAYELGISVGSVGAILHRVYEKLGVAGRSQLLDVLRVPTTLSRGSLGNEEELLVFSLPRLALRREDAEKLSEAERQVVAAVLRGLSNIEVASELGKSVNTVEGQLASVSSKLGLTSRAELIRRCSG